MKPKCKWCNAQMGTVGSSVSGPTAVVCPQCDYAENGHGPTWDRIRNAGPRP